VHATLDRLGQSIIDTTRSNLKRHGLERSIVISGKPSWSLLQFKDTPTATAAEVKSLYLQEIIARGILTAGSHNLCYAHTGEDLERLARAQDETMGVVREAIERADIAARLAGPPIQPVFRVR